MYIYICIHIMFKLIYGHIDGQRSGDASESYYVPIAEMYSMLPIRMCIPLSARSFVSSEVLYL